jgi:hypothetical protein
MIGWQAKAPAPQGCSVLHVNVGQTLSSANPAINPILCQLLTGRGSVIRKGTMQLPSRERERPVFAVLQFDTVHNRQPVVQRYSLAQTAPESGDKSLEGFIVRHFVFGISHCGLDVPG